MDIEIKRMAKIALIMPAVLIWDVFFWTLSQIYKGASYVDTVGGDKLDKFMER
jgi:hypothetical protein